MNEPDDYDTITCELPLITRPVANTNQHGDDMSVDDNDRTYQTKSLPPVGGNTYRITSDGYLEEDMGAYANPAGYAPDRWRPVVGHTGEVRFYDILPSGLWLEYVAWVVRGSVESIYTEDGAQVY